MGAFERFGPAVGGWTTLFVVLAGWIGATIYQRFATRKEVDAARQEAKEDDDNVLRTVRHLETKTYGKITDIEKAIQRLEIGLKTTPTRAEYNETSLELERLSSGIKVMSERMDHLNATLTRVEAPLKMILEDKIISGKD